MTVDFNIRSPNTPEFSCDSFVAGIWSPDHRLPQHEGECRDVVNVDTLNTNRTQSAQFKNLKGNKGKVITSNKNKILTLSLTTNKINKYTNDSYNYRKRILQLANDIELNPGPNNVETISYVKKSNLFTLTYNVRGGKDPKKLIRLINFFKKLPFKNNSIINLQETHFNDLDYSNLIKYWKTGSIHSPSVNNSGGVAILYNKNYFDEIIQEEKVINSRMCSLIAKKDGDKYCFINLYAPNNDLEMQMFLNELDNYLFKICERHPDMILNISGDFNLVLDANKDSINRNQTKLERKSVEYLKQIMCKYGIVDSYREANSFGGYTWGRDNPKMIRSRLDLILISKCIKHNIASSSVYLQPNESDHRLLVTELDNKEVKFGPGILRANAELLKVPEIKERISENIKKTIGEVTSETPHIKLDYVKMKLRNLLVEEGKIVAKVRKTNLNYCNIEIERLTMAIDNELGKHDNKKCKNHPGNCLLELDKLKNALLLANEELNMYKEEESQRLIFRSRVKWAEKGEKSNKYFLNLLKDRQRKMQIRKITANGVTKYEQDEISKAITKFYKELYNKKDVKSFDPNHNMFKNLPQLEETDKNNLSKELTLEELHATLKTCKESAPGPDGITYGTYESLWSLMGPLILESWNHSNKLGHASNSQKHSIITLLEKKGKDKTKIENLRPISLSNCDIKICTKTIALRTNIVLSKLLNNTQTGYVPGRQVNDNSRFLEELIEHYKGNNKIAYLITLDAQKAFDSINHSYMLSLLKHYNFPDEYINWIKMLYTDLEASVQINGYTGEKFKILQSVKQGDALSCALFILCMEPLLNFIKNNKKIKGVKLNAVDEDTEINNFSFADDITAVCENIEGIQEIIDCYTEFTSYSGVKLNIPKTEILIIGKKSSSKTVFKITSDTQEYTIHDQEKVKICGITFSNNSEIAYKENIQDKITKCERQLNIWRQRNLTLKGKILIAKTFGISQLVYSLQATEIKDVDLKRIEGIIYKFIWNIKPTSTHSMGRLNREIMKSDYSDGGLKAPDIWLMDEALKFKHYLRCHTSTHPIAKHTVKEIQKKGAMSNYFKKIKTVKEKFEKIIYDDVVELKTEGSMINTMYKSYFKNLTFKESSFYNNQQSMIAKRLQSKGINTLGEIVNEFTLNRRLDIYLELVIGYNSIPKIIRDLIKNPQNKTNTYKMLPYKTNIWKPYEKLTSADIRKRLQPKICFKYKDYLEKKHNVTLNMTVLNPFLSIKKCLIETKMQNQQYKFLHNIYPTTSNLYKWKINSNDKCTNCNVTDNLKHSIFDCEITKISLANLLNVMKTCNVIVDDLTYEKMLLGTSCFLSRNYNKYYNAMAIDTILVLFKVKMVQMRNVKRVLDVGEIENFINSQIRIEKEILCKTKWKQKWGDFVPQN